VIFAQRDHELQTLASHGSDDTFTNRIRHGRPYWRLDDVHSHVAHALINLCGKNCVPIMDQYAVCMIGSNNFSELFEFISIYGVL